MPLTVAINHFSGDTQAELDAISTYVAQRGLKAHVCTHWADGGAGAQELAQAVIDLADSGSSQFRPLYDDDMSLWDKTRTIARAIYGADDINADQKIRDQFKQYEKEGYGHFPICMAKTQYSFSTDPALMGAPSSHNVKIRELSLAAGLPRVPAANSIAVNAQGEIEGLF